MVSGPPRLVVPVKQKPRICLDDCRDIEIIDARPKKLVSHDMITLTQLAEARPFWERAYNMGWATRHDIANFTSRTLHVKFLVLMALAELPRIGIEADCPTGRSPHKWPYDPSRFYTMSEYASALLVRLPSAVKAGWSHKVLQATWTPKRRARRESIDFVPQLAPIEEVAEEA